MKILKILGTLFLSLFIVFHSMNIVLLVLPDNPLKRQYSKLNASYTLPFFPQVWLVFGPQFKGVSSKLFYRCKAGEKRNWGKWSDPSKSILKKFQQNRMSAHSYSLRIMNSFWKKTYNSFVRAFSKNGNPVEFRIKNGEEFDNYYKFDPEIKRMKEFISSLCIYQNPDLKITNAQFYLGKIKNKNPFFSSENPRGKREIKMEKFPSFKVPKNFRLKFNKTFRRNNHFFYNS